MLSGWKYRKKQVITGLDTSILTNYQIHVTVHFGAGVDTSTDVYLNSLGNTDFSDLRFTRSNGTTLLDYWIYEKVDSDYAKVWVEVNSIPASPGSTTLYMYYGNSSAATLSDADNTMVFWDNFDSGLGKWTSTQSFVFVSTAAPFANKLNINTQAGHPGAIGGVKSNSTFNKSTNGDFILEYTNFIYSFSNINNNLFLGIGDSSIFLVTTNIPGTANARRAGYQGEETIGKTFSASNGSDGFGTINTVVIDWTTARKVSIAWFGTSSSLLVDDTVLNTISGLNDNANYSIYINIEPQSSAEDISIDYIWIRKYSQNPPTLRTWVVSAGSTPSLGSLKTSPIQRGVSFGSGATLGRDKRKG